MLKTIIQFMKLKDTHRKKFYIQYSIDNVNNIEIVEETNVKAAIRKLSNIAETNDITQTNIYVESIVEQTDDTTIEYPQIKGYLVDLIDKQLT